MEITARNSISELNDLVQQAKEISQTVVAKEGPEADAKGTWVKESMEALKASKLTGLVVPRESGGLGQGLFALAKICETLGSSYASVGLCFGMHCVGSAVISAKATAWHKQKYLEPIAQGKHLTSLALSERGTGAHFYVPQTTLMQVADDQFLINGEKTFVTNGGQVDSYVLSTMGASEDAGPDQFSCVILDENTPGMHWGKDWDGLGMRGNSSKALKVTNLTVSARQILGEQGDQLWYVFNVVAPYFLIAMSSTYLGIAASAVEEGKKSLQRRVYAHNGSSPSQLSVLQHRLGTLWAKVERTRALIYEAAQRADANDPSSIPLILSAKAEAATCCVDAVNEVMTLSGGIGYENNSFLNLLLRDARASHVMTPTTDILYTWIGRSLLDQPLLSE